jgi:predicted DCC family thiol-disulfide oxidoreductase YuxK
MPQTTSEPYAVLLIDGECVLCNGFAKFVMKRDPEGRLKFAPLQSATARRLLAERGVENTEIDTFMLILGPKVYMRSDASLRALGLLDAPWKWAQGLLLIPRFIRNTVYNLIARFRYRLFGRTTMCGLLTPQERARLLPDE